MSLSPPAVDPEFGTKRVEWIRCLEYHDPSTDRVDRNCVFAQITRMIWDAASYRVILAGRRIADRDVDGRLKLHELTHSLLDRCFMDSQLTAIRRLTDNHPLDGDRGVFSLRSLLEDMQTHHTLFTRQNLFGSFRWPMDIQATADAEQVHLKRMLQPGVPRLWLPRETDPVQVTRLHEAIDRLCGVQAGQRSAADVVSERVFASLKDTLACVNHRIETYVNKFLAHAATPESRAKVEADAVQITLEEVSRAQEVICRVWVFLDRYLLRELSHQFVAIPSDDIFRYADLPLVTSTDIAELRNAWDTYEHETNGWSEDLLDWLLGEEEKS